MKWIEKRHKIHHLYQFSRWEMFWSNKRGKKMSSNDCIYCLNSIIYVFNITSHILYSYVFSKLFSSRKGSWQDRILAMLKALHDITECCMPEYWKMHIQINVHWKLKKNDVAMQQMRNQRTDAHISVKVFAVRA